MKTIKTKAQAETSNTEYLAGISKSAEPEQSLDGQTQTPALPDAQLNLDRESERVSGSTGIPSADGVPAIQAEDPDLARLRADWPSLAPLDRTERLKALIANNHSRRALARAIGCSEGSVRQYLSFSLLTDQDKQALQQGSLSGKEARKKVHERKVHERLAQVRLSQQEWTKEIERLVRVSLDWFGSLGLARPYLKQLMYELSGGDQDIRLREFRQHAPALWEIPIGKDAQEVIASCRPKGDPASMSGPEYFNWCFVWCARWTQRLMPDPKLRSTVLHLVARQLQLLS